MYSQDPSPPDSETGMRGAEHRLRRRGMLNRPVVIVNVDMVVSYRNSVATRL